MIVADTIIKTIENIKKGKATGHEKITVEIVKNLGPEGMSFLAKILKMVGYTRKISAIVPYSVQYINL